MPDQPGEHRHDQRDLGGYGYAMTSDRPDPGNISDVVRALITEAHPGAGSNTVEEAASAALYRIGDLSSSYARRTHPAAWVLEETGGERLRFRAADTDLFAEPHRFAGRPTSSIISAVVLVLGVVGGLAVAATGVWAAWASAAIAGTGAFASMLISLSGRFALSMSPFSGIPDPGWHVASDQSTNVRGEGEYLLSASELTLFALMTVSPQHFRHRVEERLEWHPDGIRCTTLVRQRLPHVWIERVARENRTRSLDGQIALPVPLGRGALNRLPEINEEWSGAVTMVSRNESAHAILQVFRRLIMMAFGGKIPSELRNVDRSVAEIVLNEDYKALSLLADLCEDISSLGNNAADTTMLELAGDFVVAAVRDRVVVALFTSRDAESQRFAYHFNYPLSHPSTGSRSWFRTVLVAPPDTVHYRPWLALTSQEYAFSIQWAAGTYVNHLSVVPPESGVRSFYRVKFENPVGSREARLAISRPGQDAESPDSPPGLKVSFRQKPATTTALVPLLAILGSVLVWLSAHSASGVPVLLLSATAAGTLISYGQAVRHHTDASGLIRIASSFVVMCAAIVLGFVGPTADSVGSSFLGLPGLVWQSAFAVSIIHAISSLTWWTASLRTYIAALRQPLGLRRTDLEIR